MTQFDGDLDFDFGFTTVSEEELEAVRIVQEQASELEAQLVTVDSRAKALYEAVLPLINNLKINPEKDYIYWPNRVEKLEAFAQKLTDIMNGEQ